MGGFQVLRKGRTLRRGGDRLPLAGVVLLEFGAIVAAVVLGFMVNEWREGRARARSVDTALASLAQEMTHNHHSLEQVYSYHIDMLASIEAIPKEERSTTYGYQLPGWRGARLPGLRSSTFAMLVSTGSIAHLPFAQADRLALVYNLQKVIEKLDEVNLASIANDPAFANAQSLYHVFFLYSELVPSLLALYQEYGRSVLAPHGYNLGVHHERLRAVVEEHRRDYLASIASRNSRGQPKEQIQGSQQGR